MRVQMSEGVGVTELPSGIVTFLFTDLEGSTRLWEEHPDAMQSALARHDEVLRSAIEARGGYVVKMTGDGAHAVFSDAAAAVGAAVDVQCAVSEESWGEVAELRVRMGIHTGPAEQRAGDYFGPAVNRAARLMSVAHGGQIVVSLATEELVRDVLGDGVDLVDLGEQRLRDLARSERVFQLSAPGLRGEFPPLRSLDAVSGNLPPQLTSFVGRDADVVEVLRALRAGVLVTLVGVGGVGKTRLALRCAADASGDFRDGVWLCELAGARDPEVVPDALASVFDLQPRQGQTVTEALVDFLRAKDTLLVLDNCEHLMRRAAELIRTIEGSCPGVRVLATSREGLKVAGEQVVLVSALDVPDEETDRESIARSESVRLFVERGRAARPDFGLTDTNADSVARVCRRLDGLPLAIELAAARLSMLTPEELAGRLDQRFRLLTGGDRFAVERHQTLRAAVDWSYDLLDASEQRLLDRLSVFAGGFMLDAAEVVCAGEGIDGEVFDSLAGLVAQSLVVADVQEAQTRYRLLETIRQYAQERLAAAGDTETLRAHHARYYTRFAEGAASYLAGPDEIAWARQLAREADNLHAALAWALDHHDVDLALRLTGLCDAHNVSFTEIGRAMRASAEIALQIPNAARHPVYPSVVLQAGWDACERGEMDRAERYFDDAVIAFEQRGVEPVTNLWVLGVGINSPGSEELAEYRERAIAACRARGDTLGLATMLAAQAASASRSDQPRAILIADEALEIAGGLTNARAMSQVFASAGYALAEAQPARALALLRRALELAEASGSRGFGLQAAMAGGVAALNADRRQALEFYAAAIHDLHWTGIRPLLGAVLYTTNTLLALDSPRDAAILDGAPLTLSGRHMVTDDQFWGRARQHADRALHDAVDAQHRDELAAQGAAMNDDQAVTYALTAIDRVLDQEPSDT